jgi:hypothetical protein
MTRDITTYRFDMYRFAYYHKCSMPWFCDAECRFNECNVYIVMLNAVMLSVIILYAVFYYYAECNFTECRVLFLC